jgi:hypothetical protein
LDHPLRLDEPFEDAFVSPNRMPVKHRFEGWDYFAHRLMEGRLVRSE